MNSFTEPASVRKKLLRLIALPDAHALQRWGYVAGLATQPAWIWATLRARQWGMALLSLLYIAMWIIGIANRFEVLA